MPQCEHCGKPLVTIGSGRKNGKPHADWATRKYHKKCWKELQFVIKWGVVKFAWCELIAYAVSRARTPISEVS